MAKMDAKTLALFSSNFYGVPRMRRGHVPKLTRHKTGSGYLGVCSCGFRFHRSTGCTAPGLGYAVAAAHHEFKKHVAAAASKRKASK